MTETTRHIVFDVGNVLIHYDREAPYRHLIPDADKRAWFLDHVTTVDWNVEQDRGRSWADGEAELIASFPDWETEIRAFRTHWKQMVPYAYEDSVAILLGLIEDGCDITFLTNFAADTFVEGRQMYPFLQSGRGATVSGRVKLLKPDPAIYALHTQTFDLEPAATLFIDDSPRNVEAARAFGWQAVQFTNAEALREDLQRFGFRLD